MEFELESQPIIDKLKTLEPCEVGNYLEAHGFKKRFIHSSMRSIYLSKTLVVKRPFIVARKPNFGKHIVPSIRFRAGKQWWAIQPRCDTKDAYGAFMYMLSHEAIDTWKDHAMRNCGWYKGIPVIFDW